MHVRRYIYPRYKTDPPDRNRAGDLEIGIELYSLTLYQLSYGWAPIRSMQSQLAQPIFRLPTSLLKQPIFLTRASQVSNIATHSQVAVLQIYTASENYWRVFGLRF